MHTEDLDILYSLDESNRARLLEALRDLAAVFRDDPRRLVPNESHVASRGHKLFTTRFGDLDCRATIEDDTTYEDVTLDTVRMTIGDAPVSVLSLPRLIVVKEKLSRPKDQLALLHLRATLEEHERLK